MSDNKKKRKPLTRSEWISLVSILVTVLLAIWVYNQNEKINALSKGEMANELLISSFDMDSLIDIEDSKNITVDVNSNYDGAIPLKVIPQVVRHNGDEIASGYKLSPISQEEVVIEKDGKLSFMYAFETDKNGDYEIDFTFYYNYKQEEGYQKGSTKTWTLRLTAER